MSVSFGYFASKLAKNKGTKNNSDRFRIRGRKVFGFLILGFLNMDLEVKGHLRSKKELTSNERA